MKGKYRAIAAIALILCLVSMIGTSLVTSDLGRVQVTNVSIRTEIGTLTGYLLVPDGASAQNKAPAVVVSHGSSASAEFVDSWYTELARRGYVVFAPNLYGHGDTPLPDKTYADTISYRSNGIYDAVEYLSTLSCVDATRIGVTGHSLGGGSALTTAEYYSNLEWEALQNGAEEAQAHALNKVAGSLSIGYPLDVNIAAAGVSTKFEGYLCDVGVVLGKYDDFQAWMNNGFLTNGYGAKWLNSQTGIAEVQGGIVEGEYYTNPENGYCFAGWNPPEIHNQNLISSSTNRALIEFFDHTLGAPTPIDSGNQLWMLKKGLGLVGMAGFFMFLLPAMYYLLKAPIFSGLAATKEVAAIPPLAGKAKRRFYVTTVVGALINTVLLVPMILVGSLALVNPIWPQSGTSGFALWGVMGGLVTLWMLRLGFGKFKGRSEELGTKVSGKQWWKTLLLAFAVVGTAYLLVLGAKYFFNTDFRAWSYAIRPFGPGRLLQALRYLPLFAVFQITNAMATRRNNFAGWSDGKRIVFSTVVCMIPIILMLLITYLPILFIGMPMWGQSGSNILLLAMGNGAIKLLSFIVSLAVISVINVKAQKLTGNIWLGALVNAALITMITVANCDSIVNF